MYRPKYVNTYAYCIQNVQEVHAYYLLHNNLTLLGGWVMTLLKRNVLTYK